MASPYSPIKRSTDQFKQFLELKRDEFEGAQKEFKRGKGWNIPYRSSYIFGLVERMYDTLYWGIHPLLFDEDLTPGESILVRFENTLAYLAEQEKEFEDIGKHSDDGVLDIVSSQVYDLWKQTFDKLAEVVALAKADMQAAAKPTTTNINKPIRAKSLLPQPPVPVPPTFSYKYTGMPWHKPKFPSLASVEYAALSPSEKRVEVLIMVATKVELDQVMRLLDPPSGRNAAIKVVVKQETYYLGTFGCFRAVVCKSTMGSGGPTGSSLVADSAIKKWKPIALVMIGIAFGASYPRQNAADVLVAKSLYPYEAQRAGDKIIPRSPIPPTNETLFNRFDNAGDWEFLRPDGTPVEVHPGLLFTGEKLIDSLKFKQKLMKLAPEAIGGEMEGAGVWAAAARNSVAWIVVKSVCDWAEHKEKSLQEMAAASAASLCKHILSDKQALNGLRRPR